MPVCRPRYNKLLWLQYNHVNLLISIFVTKAIPSLQLIQHGQLTHTIKGHHWEGMHAKTHTFSGTLTMHFSQLLGKTYSLVIEMHKFCMYANLYY